MTIRICTWEKMVGMPVTNHLCWQLATGYKFIMLTWTEINSYAQMKVQKPKENFPNSGGGPDHLTLLMALEFIACL